LRKEKHRTKNKYKNKNEGLDFSEFFVNYTLPLLLDLFLILILQNNKFPVKIQSDRLGATY